MRFFREEIISRLPMTLECHEALALLHAAAFGHAEAALLALLIGAGLLALLALLIGAGAQLSRRQEISPAALTNKTSQSSAATASTISTSPVMAGDGVGLSKDLAGADV